MNYTLKDIMDQAVNDRTGVETKMPKGVSVISHGIKIQSFESKIEILNCSRGGHYYQEILPKEYDYFFENGWKKGKVQMAINNCVYKLDLIESRMKIEMNTRKNDKHIQNLKTRRENLLVKYADFNQKLNNITN
tara:strand:- start:112 stop:513 length:402 start_codon:yes stop_codon:yes gene_type:complete